MNQIDEKKCDGKRYDQLNDYRSTLIKMEVPNYGDNEFGGSRYIIFRAVRLIGYFTVILLLGFLLWRMQVIESKIEAQEKLRNITDLVRKESLSHRFTRSLKQSDFNNFGVGDKELPRGSLLTSKNEGPVQPMEKIQTKDDFERMVNRLFFQIQKMHNDTDRSHFDNNIKAVFQAWFPVFDALLPSEFMDNQETQVDADKDKSTQDNGFNALQQRFTRQIQKKSSEESSEEKKPQKSNIKKIHTNVEELLNEESLRQTRSAEDSSEEKRNTGGENSTIKKNSGNLNKKNGDSNESSESGGNKINTKKNRSNDGYEVINLIPNFEGDETTTSA